MSEDLSWVSMWWSTLPPHLTSPVGQRLESDTDADVAIVGAGFTGLWTAYFLQRADPTLRIAVIEARQAGFGASGRNGGWASALFPTSMESIARASSRESAMRLMRQMQANVDDLGRVIAEEGWDVGWHKGGSLVLARTPPQWQRVQDDVREQRSWGFDEADIRLLTRRETEEQVQATDVLGASFTPHCAAVNPARLVRNLAHAVVRGGARVYENSPAIAIEPGIVRTGTGCVRAPIVVQATEGYTRTLRGQRRRLAPIYSLMIATEPLDESLWRQIGLEDRSTFSDGRHVIVYGQRTADGRLAFGGRGAWYRLGSSIADENDRVPRLHQSLWEALVDMFPAVSDAAVTHAWGGPLGAARDWWASCGLDRETGLAWSGGYVGDGVTTSFLGGRTLADLITQTDSNLVTLPWVDHHSPAWEPEPWRWLGVNGGLRMSMRADTAEERTGRASRTAGMIARMLGH